MRLSADVVLGKVKSIEMATWEYSLAGEYT